MLTKNWTTKADFEAGTLNNLLVPEGLNRLELKRKALSGTATYIVDGAAGWSHPNRKFTWLSFEHSKEDTKIILRDEFLENTLAEYYLERMYGTWPYTAPTYNAANKWVYFDTGDDKGFSMRPKNISVQNFILTYKFRGYSKYGTNFNFHSMGRWVDNNNMYMPIITDPGSPWPSTIGKVVATVFTDLTTGAVYHSIGTTYQSITTFNGNSLKVELVGVGSLSVNDGTFPGAGPVKIGAYQGKGFIDNLLLEHYALPSPPGTTVSFKFWGSKDGADWGPEYTDADIGVRLPSWYRYLKIQATLSRNSLASAMPVLNSMTLTYKVLVEPIFV